MLADCNTAGNCFQGILPLSLRRALKASWQDWQTKRVGLGMGLGNDGGGSTVHQELYATGFDFLQTISAIAHPAV